MYPSTKVQIESEAQCIVSADEQNETERNGSQWNELKELWVAGMAKWNVRVMTTPTDTAPKVTFRFRFGADEYLLESNKRAGHR